MKFIFQIDPLDSLNHDTDSTVALIKAAIKRGVSVFCYTRKELYFDKQTVKAKAQKVELENDALMLGKFHEVKLHDFVVIFFRDEPPFDMSYVTSTYLLDRVRSNILYINNPGSVRDFPEKLSVLDYSKYMPETCVASNMKTIMDFHAKYRKTVMKPLYGFGGQDVEVIESDEDLKNHFEYLSSKHLNVPVMIQRYIENVHLGDKRVLLLDGEVLGVINRVPKKKSFKANLVAGGTAQKTTLTEREHKISQEIAVHLKKSDIFFAGIDLIDGYLTEINVTCPTGLVSYNNLYGLEGRDKLENKIIEKILSKVQNITH